MNILFWLLGLITGRNRQSPAPKHYYESTPEQLSGKAGFLWGRGTLQEHWSMSSNGQVMKQVTKQLQEHKFTGTYEFPVSAYDYPSSVTMENGVITAPQSLIEA